MRCVINPSRGMRAARANRALLAEHIAEGGSQADFAREHSLTERGVQKMWAAIREEMGAQAI